MLHLGKEIACVAPVVLDENAAAELLCEHWR